MKADFKVEQGRLPRSSSYDTFGGTVNYGGKGIDVDARLQQNPTTWIDGEGLRAGGRVQLRDQRARTRTGRLGPKEDQFDLHVDSSPIDLGLVQGFTTELTKVTGTLQAKVDVTGAADDPHPNGVVTIQNGAFTVEPTGVNYTNLDATDRPAGRQGPHRSAASSSTITRSR